MQSLYCQARPLDGGRTTRSATAGCRRAAAPAYRQRWGFGGGEAHPGEARAALLRLVKQAINTDRYPRGRYGSQRWLSADGGPTSYGLGSVKPGPRYPVVRLFNSDARHGFFGRDYQAGHPTAPHLTCMKQRVPRGSIGVIVTALAVWLTVGVASANAMSFYIGGPAEDY